MRKFSENDLDAAYDGLRHGRTVRECVLALGGDIPDSPALRVALKSRYGVHAIDEVIRKHVRPDKITVLKKALDHAGDVMKEPLEAFVSSEEQRRRRGICRGCEKMEGGRCNFCDCPIVDLVKFRKVDCELRKW